MHKPTLIYIYHLYVALKLPSLDHTIKTPRVAMTLHIILALQCSRFCQHINLQVYSYAGYMLHVPTISIKFQRLVQF